METIDWKNLGFGYRKADYNIRCWYRNGKWGELEVSGSEQVTMHMAATALHYGQEAFEGLKAFRGKDNKVRVFRMDENAKRMRNSANGIMMAPVPEDLFMDAIRKAVKMNEEHVPPFESGASLYIRPLLIGTGPQIGVKPADEFLFMVFVMPVGPYFKEGFKPTDLVIYREYDRAAPRGTGIYKVGGNYAASLRAGTRAHAEGYSAVLFLDAKEKKYLDECGPANFFGIKNNIYVTPKSTSILPSITNMSLRQLAADMGMTVEERKIPVEELAEFEEVGACGTAAVISPIKRVYDADLDKEYLYGKEPGAISQKLYNKLRAIQYGTEPDPYGWTEVIE
ncbi:branched-chain amino acid aminotransferase [Prolixibacter sp. SD074]|uniref:branched-chain amino acid aminotransferase n=1 Tax=Prolixibacter sp. SD074 TaxID=2652391 RepID=UPI0012840520|nr:branched-chain amino acid aminotransferase [Prolixibacter sp. SD074]GET30536.1 branched chain amino acid aminotransferase [Prolixibacter sp. SD074]